STGSKAALAMRFGSVAAGLKDLSSSLNNVSTDTQLWSSMVEATAAVANAVVQNVAHRCFEEGALLARLWNLHTALMDSGLAAARKAQEQLSVTAAEQAAKIRRLDPLIDWELEGRTAREELTTALETSRAEALLAGRERDALLRENDKIIAHYRKELKTYRREQRRNAYRLARKLRNTQQQLELMTRDRDVLYNAVSYTKSQTAQLVDLIAGLHGHLRSVMQGATAGGNGKVSFEILGEEAFPELQQIEQGLKNILHSLQKVRDVTQDAEDSHFVMEEQVTAVAAADTTGDELVDEVLAEGDPEPSPEELEAEAAAAAALERQNQHQNASDSDFDSDEPDPNSALSMMAEAALRGTGESSEEGEDDEEFEGDDGAVRRGGQGGSDTEDEAFPGQRQGQEDDLGGDRASGAVGGELYPEISPTAVADEGGILEDEADEGEALDQELPSRDSRSLQTRSSSSPIPPTLSGAEEDLPTGTRTPISRGASRSVSPDVVPSAPRAAGSGGVPVPANANSTGKQDGSANRQDGKAKKKNKGKNKGRGNAGGGGDNSAAGDIGGPGFGPGGAGTGGEGKAPGGDGYGAPSGTASSGTRTTPGASFTQVGQMSHNAQEPQAAHGAHGGHGHGHGHNGHGSGSAVDGHGGTMSTLSSFSRSPSPTTPLPRGRAFNVASNSSQTGPELLRGVADPDIAEAAKQMKALREALSEIGIVGNPNDDADGTDGLLTALRQYMSSLSSEAGTLSKQLEKLKLVAESAESARTDLAQTAEARGREVAAVRRELLDAKKRYSQLCDALEALGIDPRSPRLPNQADGDNAVGPTDGVRTPGSRGSVKGGRDNNGESKGGKGAKVSRLAAVKEKARERAMAATVPQAPVLGRTSTTAVRSGGNSGYAAPSNRVTLPAAMLAAAQQRAVEAAAAGE
ncbi:hypothetical protein Vretifemale_6669, partial [Volvox reticuliferus]